MISRTAGYTGSSSAHSFNDVLIRNFDIDGIVKFRSHLFQGFCQGFGLRNGPRKSVQDESFLCIFPGQPVYYQVNNQLIRYQSTLIHIGLCFLTKLSTVFDIRSEDVSRGDVGNTVLCSDLLCLCALACTGCT